VALPIKPSNPHPQSNHHHNHHLIIHGHTLANKTCNYQFHFSPTASITDHRPQSSQSPYLQTQNPRTRGRRSHEFHEPCYFSAWKSTQAQTVLCDFNHPSI
jgi:hypothetical protein